jgi:hypothetical protein
VYTQFMSTFSISGTISPASFVNPATTIVTWNMGFPHWGNVSPAADGTYTIPNLAPGTYIIQVTGSNFLSPAQTVIVSNANVTGINFVCTAAPNIGVFTPIFSDSFQRANETPLGSTVGHQQWSPPNGSPGLITSTYPEILNDQAISELNGTLDGTAVYLDVAPYPVLPADQFCQWTFKTLKNGNAWIYVRSTLPGTGSGNNALEVNWSFFAINGAGVRGWGFAPEDDNSGNIPYNFVPFQPWPVSEGDTWAVGIAGQGVNSVAYVFVNGVCIWQGSLAPNPDLNKMLPNGTVGIQINPYSTPPLASDIGIINFVSGAFSVTSPSVPSGIRGILSFSKRTTTAVTVFACLGAATKAFHLANTPSIMNSLHLEHVELFSLYRRVCHQDKMNQAADLDATIAKIVTVVGQLNATVQLITPTFRNAVEVQEVQIVIANAAQTMNLVVLAETP